MQKQPSSENRTVAAFCINLDTTEFYNANQTLLAFLQLQENYQQGATETFSYSSGGIIVEVLFFWQQPIKLANTRPP